MDSTLAASSSAPGRVTFSHVFGQQCQLMEAGVASESIQSGSGSPNKNAPRSLIQGYDTSESSVQKACVFCLVTVRVVISEELKPHLSQITGSKMKPLDLYIRRAQTGSTGADPATNVPGQSQ